MTVENPTPKRRRGIYLLPNLFTTAGLFAGFYAIVAATNDRFEAAAVAIFVAMIMDSLDGRIARLTNTQSDFGKEYDSLSDMIALARDGRVGLVGLRQARLARGLRVRRRRGAPTRAFQRPARRGQQTLFPGTRQPRGGRGAREPRVGRQRLRTARLDGGGGDGRHSHRDRGPADGEQRPLPQLQGLRPARQSALHRDWPDGADLRADLARSPASAVRDRLRLCAVRPHHDIDAIAARTRPAPLQERQTAQPRRRSTAVCLNGEYLTAALLLLLDKCQSRASHAAPNTRASVAPRPRTLFRRDDEFANSYQCAPPAPDACFNGRAHHTSTISERNNQPQR